MYNVQYTRCTYSVHWFVQGIVGPQTWKRLVQPSGSFTISIPFLKSNNDTLNFDQLQDLNGISILALFAFLRRDIYISLVNVNSISIHNTKYTTVPIQYQYTIHNTPQFQFNINTQYIIHHSFNSISIHITWYTTVPIQYQYTLNKTPKFQFNSNTHYMIHHNFNSILIHITWYTTVPIQYQYTLHDTPQFQFNINTH